MQRENHAPLNLNLTYEDQFNFYFNQLLRQLENMFEWEGFPTTIQQDYLERSLIRNGAVIFYTDDNIGFDVLMATGYGFNRHNLPTQGWAWCIDDQANQTQIKRKIKRLSDSEYAAEFYNEQTDCVFLTNTYYLDGYNTVVEICKFYARKLAIVEQAITTNTLWQNIPYIFKTSNPKTKLSIVKMFNDIFMGKPFVIIDKQLTSEQDSGGASGVPFITKELYDVLNEIMMKFKEAIGFTTSGVDKAERVNTLEITSNNDYTTTTLEIMLKQRKQACEAINAFYGYNVNVRLKGAVEDGPSDDRALQSAQNE